MSIPSGKTDQGIYFVAYDSTDHTTRKTGLSAFTVYRTRNGGGATVYTTPTITEISAANMPGLYSLLIDEDTTIAAASDSEEYAVHITCATMDPVTRTFELYRDPNQTAISRGSNAVGLGTCTTGGSTTSVPTSALTLAGSAASGVVSDQFKGRTILFAGDTTTAGLKGASASITASSASNTPTLTVGTLPATPVSGDTFTII